MEGVWFRSVHLTRLERPQSANGPEHGPNAKRPGVNTRAFLSVEVLKDYLDTFPQVKVLRSDLANHPKPDTKSQERSTGLKSSVRMTPRPLRKRLAPKDRQRLSTTRHLQGPRLSMTTTPLSLAGAVGLR